MREQTLETVLRQLLRQRLATTDSGRWSELNDCIAGYGRIKMRIAEAGDVRLVGEIVQKPVPQQLSLKFRSDALALRRAYRGHIFARLRRPVRTESQHLQGRAAVPVQTSFLRRRHPCFTSSGNEGAVPSRCAEQIQHAPRRLENLC